jgi:predicted AAA+ superfamily ATPase
MESELYRQNPWWEQQYHTDTIPRETYLTKLKENIKSKEIIFITGLRRIGKTTIMYQLIHHLINQGTSPEDILYVRLDTVRLIDTSITDIIEKYREIHKKSTNEKIYVFLDEVTAKENFEQELKNIYDEGKAKVICSSSQATLMKDKKAHLTGRTKTIEIMPLTFNEFLQFKQIKILKADKARKEAYFKDYLRVGGVPHYVLTEDSEYLNELIQAIIYKDIIAQYKVTNEKVIIELFNLLCERVGKSISFSKIGKILAISVDSVKRYIQYFEKSYLFYVIEKDSKSLNERITSPKKIYIGDVGIKNIVTGFRDLGASYENLVFLKIKHLSPRYYSKNNIEIDFKVKDMLIEAKYNSTLNEKQQKVFDESICKHKIVAQGLSFFEEEK